MLLPLKSKSHTYHQTMPSQILPPRMPHQRVWEIGWKECRHVFLLQTQFSLCLHHYCSLKTIACLVWTKPHVDEGGRWSRETWNQPRISGSKLEVLNEDRSNSGYVLQPASGQVYNSNHLNTFNGKVKDGDCCLFSFLSASTFQIYFGMQSCPACCSHHNKPSTMPCSPF